MNLPRRRFLHLAAGIPAVLAAPHVARAQNYPARPLRFLVGFPAGGGADTVVRIIVPWLSDKLSQQIIVENRPGASTGLAIQVGGDPVKLGMVASISRPGGNVTGGGENRSK